MTGILAAVLIVAYLAEGVAAAISILAAPLLGPDKFFALATASHVVGPDVAREMADRLAHDQEKYRVGRIAIRKSLVRRPLFAVTAVTTWPPRWHAALASRKDLKALAGWEVRRPDLVEQSVCLCVVSVLVALLASKRR